MKDLIRNILREQSGDVPENSYPGTHYSHKERKFIKRKISKRLFFTAVSLLSQEEDKSFFDDKSDMMNEMDNPLYRRQEISDRLNVIGLSGMGYGGIIDKIFWAVVDNYDGLKDGTITDYNQLKLRNLTKYSVELSEVVREWNEYHWTVTLECFSPNDVRAEIHYDEDGEFVYYHWDYTSDNIDTDNEGSIIQKISEAGTSHSENNISESTIKEQIKASPEENDIISELLEITQGWEDGEHKKEVEGLIQKYISKPIDESRKVVIEQKTEIDNRITPLEARIMSTLVEEYTTVELASFELKSVWGMMYVIGDTLKLYGKNNQIYNNRAKQLIQFIIDNGIPTDFKQYIGEELPKINSYTFTKSYEEKETLIKSGLVVVEDTNFESAICDARNNWWDYDPDDEVIDVRDSEFMDGSVIWEEVRKNNFTIWSTHNVNSYNKKYDPNEYDC